MSQHTTAPISSPCHCISARLLFWLLWSRIDLLSHWYQLKKNIWEKCESNPCNIIPASPIFLLSSVLRSIIENNWLPVMIRGLIVRSNQGEVACLHISLLLLYNCVVWERCSEGAPLSLPAGYLLTPAWTELGTAQPQLVSLYYVVMFFVIVLFWCVWF